MSNDALLLRTVEENEPLDNKRGVTYRVQVVGGGGGSVDYSKTVQKTTTMPTADSSNAGDVYMYTGATDANYTTNYIYENITTTTSSSASATQTVGSSLSNISVDIATLESFTGWTTDNSLQIFYTADGWSVDTTSLGVTYTGTPSVGDAITITYIAEVNTYAWTRVDVQPTPSGLPSQTGNSGKFLTTDGTDASWGYALGVPSGFSIDSRAPTVMIGGTTATLFGSADGFTSSNLPKNGFVLHRSNLNGYGLELKILNGTGTNSLNYKIEANKGFYCNNYNNANGRNLGTSDYKWGKVFTEKLNNGSDITVPNAVGSMSVQVSSMPTADSSLEGQIYQYVGTTDANYTNGYFYKCVSDGQTPATYSWTAVQVQAGGGSSLPSQTGNAGKFLTTDGTDASWGVVPVYQKVGTFTAYSVGRDISNVAANIAKSAVIFGSGTTSWSHDLTDAVIIGNNANVSWGGCVAVGGSSNASGDVSIAIGGSAKATADFAIQLGFGQTNSDTNTFKVANANGNFEIMSSDGTIPAARHASLPAADGTYVLKLVISSGVPTLSWVAE